MKKTNQVVETPLRKWIREEKEAVCKSLNIAPTQANLDLITLHTFWEIYK